jgi:hypothetical protein
MLLTVVNFLSPALGRMQPMSETLGPLWFLGVPYAAALVFLAGDIYRNGKVNRPFLLGTILVVGSGPLTLMVAPTETWNQFAAWLVG